MTHSEYTTARDTLITHYPDSIKISEDDNINGQFNLVSAGLLNFLPAILYKNHEAIFRQILLHKKLSILEQSFYDVLDYVETEDIHPGTLKLLQTKPTIICTFHTGSYRVINLFLLKHNIPYALVIGKDIIAKEEDLFTGLYNGLPGNTGQNRFRLIDAESSTSGLQMLRELKAGRSLLLYIDGNTGAGSATTSNDNRCVIQFLHQQIFARRGIGFLAHASNTPIIPIVCYRKASDNIRLKFFEPIYPCRTTERTRFAEHTTQALYNAAAPLIEHYPEQWEGWLYLHKVANIVHTYDNTAMPVCFAFHSKKMVFNSINFGVIRLPTSAYLFSKKTYTFYQINENLSTVLNSSADIRHAGLPENELQELYAQGAVISD